MIFSDFEMMFDFKVKCVIFNVNVKIQIQNYLNAFRKRCIQNIKIYKYQSDYGFCFNQV